MSAETEQQHRADAMFNGVKEPRYIFYGIPLDEEGLHFMTLVKKYLNKKNLYIPQAFAWQGQLSKLMPT